MQNILLQQLQKREWPLCTAFFFVYEPPPDMGILVVSPVGRPRCPNLLESMYRVFPNAMKRHCLWIQAVVLCRIAIQRRDGLPLKSRSISLYILGHASSRLSWKTMKDRVVHRNALT